MGIVEDVDAYKAQIDLDITTKTDPRSIPPDVVGSGFDDLADIVVLYYGQNFRILGGTGVPSDLIGEDNWLYFRDNNPIEIYQKIAGSWGSPGATLNLGIIFPDGPLIGLQTAISGFVVTVTPGGWTINNVIYRKATQTQFTLSAPDANYGRYDLIYGTNADTILILEGTPSISPAIPATPVGGTMLDIAFIPSAASGNLPYLLYGNNNGQNATGDIYFTDSSINGIVCDKTAGTITLADIAGDFPTISQNGIIRGAFDLLISGTWYANDVLPSDIVKSGANLSSCVFYLGNTGITTIRGRIY